MLTCTVCFRYADMGGWQGGQAEYVLVPFADFQALVLPKERAKEHILDLAMLSDILPTGFNGAVQAGVTVGRTVYIAGAGPVGICAAASSVLLGAAVVVVGDVNPARLPNVAKLGPAVKPLDLSKVGSSPSDLRRALKELIGEEECECAIDACGFEATSHGDTAPSGREQSNVILNSCFHILTAGGGIGIPGLYVRGSLHSPHAHTTHARTCIVLLHCLTILACSLHPVVSRLRIPRARTICTRRACCHWSSAWRGRRE